MSSKTKILIGIVDDHTLVRQGLATLMSEFDEIDVVFEAENGLHLQEIMQKKIKVDVILLDINMPKMNGIQCANWIKQFHPEVKILALSMSDEDNSIQEMVQAGAKGYVLKESKPLELLLAIKTLKEKGFFINKQVSGRLLAALKKNKAQQKYSDNEITFLHLCCTELTYRQIAEKMNVSSRTVDNYRESLFKKLNVRTRTTLALSGIKNGLVKNW